MGRVLQRYKKLFDELKSKPLHRIYFLYGPEDYIKKEFVHELIKVALSPENRTFNLDIFEGDEFDRPTFEDRVSSFPLFASRRVVVVKHFDALATANKDFVIEWIGRLQESIILVVETSQDRLDTVRMKKMAKLSDETGLSFRFQHLSDEETVERIRGRVHREGLAIDPEAVEMLVQSVGTHLADVTNEVEKIILGADDDEVIRPATVAAVVGKYRTENVFSFLDELGKPNSARLVQLMNRVIDSGEEPVFVLAMLLKRTLQLLEVKALLLEMGSRGRSSKALASRLGGRVSPFMVGKLLDQCQRFEINGLLTQLDNFRWAEFKLKSSSLPPRTLIETAVLASTLGKRLAQPAN